MTASADGSSSISLCSVPYGAPARARDLAISYGEVGRRHDAMEPRKVLEVGKRAPRHPFGDEYRSAIIAILAITRMMTIIIY
jgi:hypothetical protein